METLRRTRIADLFRTKPIGTTVKVKGWVRTRRGNKQVGFIALNDGSTIKNIQIVIDLDKFDEEALKVGHGIGRTVHFEGLPPSSRLRTAKVPGKCSK